MRDSPLMNTGRARRCMEKYNLDAIVASSPTNVGYLTGFDCWMYGSFRENMFIPGGPKTLKQAYAIVSPDSGPKLVVETFTAPFLADTGVEIRGYGSVRVEPAKRRTKDVYQDAFEGAVSKQRPTPGDALVSVLEELSTDSGRVGVELSNMSEGSKRLLKRSFPKIELLDCPELIRLIRMVKTEEEVDRLKTAARINEAALNKSLSVATPGEKTARMMLAYGREVASRGASVEHYIFSPRGMGISSSGEYSFGKNEFTSVDCGCVYEKYYADTGTTLVIGSGRKDAEKMHARLWSVVEGSVEMLRPGKTPAEVLAWFSRAYEREGIRGVGYQGHGIGMETREHPIINKGGLGRIRDGVVDESVEIPFEEGMTINIETPIYDPGRASYQVERTFLIGRRSVSEITPKRGDSPFVSAPD